MNVSQGKFFFQHITEEKEDSQTIKSKNALININVKATIRSVIATCEIGELRLSGTSVCSIDDNFNGRYGRVFAASKLIKKLKELGYFIAAKEIKFLVVSSKKNIPYLYLLK